MIFSRNWVNKYTDTSAIPLDELQETVSQSLAEIETVTPISERYNGIIIGQVKKIDSHPDADKLVVVQVDVGDEVQQVVTGAHNFQEGDYVVYLPLGVKVPYNAYPDRFDGIIKAVKLRGVDSAGMLASEKELALADDHSGLLVLPTENQGVKAKPGLPFSEFLGWQQEQMLEIENKALTHRGDVFSSLGIAREVAAALDLEFKVPQELEYLDAQDLKPTTDDRKRLEVKVRALSSCPRYSAVVISGIKIGPSPLWLKALLAKFGIASINNVVDVTNYVMLELGQPLHAFDYDKLVPLTGEKVSIEVRKANKGEQIKGIDNKEHELTEENTIITASGEKPIAIGGIIGGKETAIDDQTTTIVIESANFDMYSIRKASMRLGIFTDAATIFSRYQDPHKTITGLARAYQLLKEIKAGQPEVASEVADDYPNPVEPKRLVFSLRKANKFIGEDIPRELVLDKLSRLGLKPTVGKSTPDLVELTIPTSRHDLSLPADIYEEIVRLYGLNKLKETLPTRTVATPPLNKLWQFKQQLREILVAGGMYETVNFNFISAKLYQNSNLDVDHLYRITNAISPDVEYMRSLLLPGLLNKVQENLRFNNQFGLFEIGKVHRKDLTFGTLTSQPVEYTPGNIFNDPDNLPIEDEHLAWILADKEEQFDGAPYYWGKQYADLLIDRLRIPGVEYNHQSEFSKKAKDQFPLWLKTAYLMFNPGRTAVVTANIEDKNYYLGVLGEFHPQVAKQMGVARSTVGVELSLHILQDVQRPLRFLEPSKYPVVEQDYCFIVDKDVPYEAVIKPILGVQPGIVRRVAPVDIYQSPQDQERKQVTVRVTLQSDQATLTEEIIQKVRQEIITAVIDKTAGELKG